MENNIENKLNISVPLVPLVKTSNHDLDIVRTSIKECLPYLKKISNITYYPVTTYIIDEYSYNKFVDVYENQRSDLLDYSIDDLLEIMKFLVAVCVTVHTQRFINLELDRKRFYNEFDIGLSYEAQRKLIINCEVTFFLHQYLTGEEVNNRFFIPEISQERDIGINIIKSLRKVQELLKLINKKYSEIRLASDYFCYDRDKPDLNIWKKIFSSQIDEIEKCIDNNGLWKKDLSHILTVLDIVLDFFEKYMKTRSSRNGRKRIVKHRISKTIHLFGCYCRRENNTIYNNLIQELDITEWLNQDNSGKVFICLERCKKRIRKYSNEINISESKLLKNLIKATIIHEHTHALIYEGIDKSLNNMYFKDSYNINKRFDLVNECLAEWSELNYFRNNSMIYHIIYEHANYKEYMLDGGLTDWPYNSALIIEQYKSNKDIQLIIFRSLLKFIRSGNAIMAYKLLRLYDKY